MCENLFREFQPHRNYNGINYADYKRYKQFLADNFNGRCGYTNCHHNWFGGINNFHIDHFIPWKKHPENPGLKTNYANLVYACSYVNIAKSDDEGEFIDPCDNDFNNHFYRDHSGNILPKDDSVPAKYMYKKLKLYLKRYGIIWVLDQLEQRMFRLQELIEATDNDEARALFVEIGMRYNDYKRYLRAVQ
ncbi:MAG: HNH endonuclease [Bacteroidales bacterium]